MGENIQPIILKYINKDTTVLETFDYYCFYRNKSNDELKIAILKILTITSNIVFVDYHQVIEFKLIKYSDQTLDFGQNQMTYSNSWFKKRLESIFK